MHEKDLSEKRKGKTEMKHVATKLSLVNFMW